MFITDFIISDMQAAGPRAIIITGGGLFTRFYMLTDSGETRVLKTEVEVCQVPLRYPIQL